MDSVRKKDFENCPLQSFIDAFFEYGIGQAHFFSAGKCSILNYPYFSIVGKNKKLDLEYLEGVEENTSLIFNDLSDAQYMLKKSNLFEPYERCTYISCKNQVSLLDEILKAFSGKHEQYIIREFDLKMDYDNLKKLSAFQAGALINYNLLSEIFGYVVYDDDLLIGAITPYIKSEHSVEIQIDILPQYRNQGLASVLCSSFIKLCFEKNIEAHWDAANEQSMFLARKLGFREKFKYTALMKVNHK